MKTRLSVLCFAKVVTLIGCVSAPPIDVPQLAVGIPERWSSQTTREERSVSPDWWNDFGDATLSSVVETALERNFDLQVAAARLQMAAANARASAGALQPSLNLSYSGSRRKQNFVGFPIPGAEGRVLSTVFTNQGISLDTTWEIDLWRRLRVDAQATLAELQSAGADLRGAQLSLAGQTSKAWFAIAEAQQQVQLSETTVESFQESAELVQ